MDPETKILIIEALTSYLREVERLVEACRNVECADAAAVLWRRRERIVATIEGLRS
jgi:hypothetical protein